MESNCNHPKLPGVGLVVLIVLAVGAANAAEIFHDWRVAIDSNKVITINGMFPGPLINGSTNDNVHVNVFNDMDESVLFTWNGIQQRLNSWQDGVSGTNCPILPGTNWTYEFQFKDQLGTFSYFPSLNFQKAGGGFGPIRVNNRVVISVPFPKPEAEFDLLIGDWYSNTTYKEVRSMIENRSTYKYLPDKMLMNGKVPYKENTTINSHQSFTVKQGKTYRLRISNVGSVWSFNLRIKNHKMVLVETEGSYTNQITLDSLDVHIGQSYSVLVTADQSASDYYIVATPKLVNNAKKIAALGVLHYEDSTTNASGPIPVGPDPYDMGFSMNQARSIRWNMSTGAARPNPQGSFNVSNVTVSQTFLLNGSEAEIGGKPFFTVNDVSYVTGNTPLKLADYFGNWSDVFQVDDFSINSSNGNPQHGVFVASGYHKAWLQLIFYNHLDFLDSWHLDGFSFFVVGYGEGEWTPQSNSTYNLHDPVVRSTVQVYPKGWTAVYAYLDNPGMWNLRSQSLKNWYLGQQLYIRVYDPDPNPAKERSPPTNLLYCGKFSNLSPPPPSPYSAPPPSPTSHASSGKISWFRTIMTMIVVAIVCVNQP